MTDGRSAASNKGMPTVRIVPETIPCESSVKEDVDAGIHLAMDQIIEALTKPLSAEEQAPKRKGKEKPSRIVFKGQLGELNRFIYKRGWGDGLPVLPPTESAVREMLAGTDLPPQHVVGEIVPRHGKATVEKIAINAVMAGTLPTHMPILIACVEAVTDPLVDLGTFGTSTGSWAPFWIINGPVRNDVHVNCGSGALSPGDIANAAIGRAMCLIIKNIGGGRKAVEDMGVFGNPGKYSSVIGENEESSPWDPLHVEQGFARDESAVTLFFPNSYSQLWQYGSDDVGILSTLIYNLLPGRGGLSCLLITPPQAKTLAKKGWTKQMISKYVFEYGRVPAYRHRFFHGVAQAHGSLGVVPPNAMDSMPIIPSPDHIRILVTGGPGAFVGLACGAGLPGREFVTKKIGFPADWIKLVAKYKSFVPAYEKY
ncbi:MAG: hypothetical protein HY017_28715 [Betaproteobacteria bacterium]|nr:hypothetical protein [Betaproteobacteria bacterium]